jgi:hypothetical protein
MSKKKYTEKQRLARLEAVNRYQARNPQKVHQRLKDRREKIRLALLAGYSQGTMKCARCGFADLRVLQLDHINGGGSRYRGAGNNYTEYLSLIRAGFPPGYQILCSNCNWIKRAENGEHRKAWNG